MSCWSPWDLSAKTQNSTCVFTTGLGAELYLTLTFYVWKRADQGIGRSMKQNRLRSRDGACDVIAADDPRDAAVPLETTGGPAPR